MPITWVRLRGIQVSIGILFLVLIAHEAASVIHVYVSPLPTVDTDSVGFNYFGRTFHLHGGGRLGGMLYVKLLGTVYGLFGYSHFLGCQLSQLSFSLTIIIILECGTLLGFKTSSRFNWTIVTFGLLPSCILTTAVTMREAFQMTGFVLLFYGLLRIRVNGLDRGLLIAPLGALWLIFFHKGFAIFLLFALPLGALWATGSRADKFLAATAAGFVVLFLFGDTLWFLMLEKSSSLQRIVEGEGLEYIDSYADKVLEGRTDFNVNLKLDSLGSFLATGPLIYLYYLFSPLPWQIRGTLDIEGVGESFVRAALMLFALRGFFRARGEERRIQGFFLFLFFFMEMTWAAGTANWGTAIRHRLVAWPLLVLLGIKGLQIGAGQELEIKAPKSRRQIIRELRRQPNESAYPLD